MKKKRRPRTNKNYYFTNIHEEAIVKYASSECKILREEMYNTYIGPAFSEMVDKIVFTYKFTNLPNIDVLREECKAWLVTILNKYDPNRGPKAFSYFSVVTKNWFIHKVKQNQKRCKREVVLQDISRKNEEEFLSTNKSYVSIREEHEFWNSFYVELNSWDRDWETTSLLHLF